MKTLSSCLWRVGLLAFLSTACVVNPAHSAHLLIMVEDAAEPYSKPDGTGYANEIVIAAFAAVGIEVELKVVPYARCKTYVIGGFAVACFNMARDASFVGDVKFSESPVYSATAIYFQNSKHRLAARSESELGRSLTIGIVNNYEYSESALQVKMRGAKFESARSEQVNLRKLALGRLDAALVMSNELNGASFMVDSAGVGNQVVATFASTKQDGFIGFSTHHPQGLWALKKYNQGFKLIDADGTIKKIWGKWSAISKRP